VKHLTAVCRLNQGCLLYHLLLLLLSYWDHLRVLQEILHVMFFLNRSLLSKSSRLVLSLFLSLVEDNQAKDVCEDVNELLLLFLFFLIRCLFISQVLVLFLRGVLLFIIDAF
jgi:hypothetical protein